MQKRVGQVSVEYVLIIVFMLLVLIPLGITVRRYVDTSSDTIEEEHIEQVANSILTTAQILYAYGEPSQNIVEFEMPRGIAEMFILDTGDEQELGFVQQNANGNTVIMYPSEVKLSVARLASCTQDVSLCAQFMCSCFDQLYFTEGKKRLLLQVQQCNSEPCVTIDEANIVEATS